MAENSSNEASAFDSTMQARTPARDIFGVLDEELPPIKVPSHVKVDARRRACELGLDLTGFLRLNLYASLYGPEHVATLHQKQLQRILGNAMPAEDGISNRPGGPLPAFLRGGGK